MNTQQTIGIRQGDLAYIKVKEMPEGLKELKTDTLLRVGSGGNPHTFKGGEFYPKEDGDFIIGYLKAKDTKIYHAEHGKKDGEKINDGIYEVRRQVEHTPEGLKPVID